MPPAPLEVAVFSPSSALLAQLHGAARVELNAPSSYLLGGTTPSLADIKSLSPQLSIPLRVMIRPRGPPREGVADFIYDAEEYAMMQKQIHTIRTSGILNRARGDGFVFGILTEHPGNGVKVDVQRCAALVELARPFPCVFHRAFDLIASSSTRWKQGLDDLQICGFRGLLTSGGEGDFDNNLERVREIVAMSGSLEVVIGGGLRHEKLSRAIGKVVEVERGLAPVYLHTAALRKDQHGATDEVVDKEELRLLIDKIRDVSR